MNDQIQINRTELPECNGKSPRLLSNTWNEYKMVMNAYINTDCHRRIIVSIILRHRQPLWKSNVGMYYECKEKGVTILTFFYVPSCNYNATKTAYKLIIIIRCYN